MDDMNKKKKIGISNKGKDNRFINNEFIGLDVGIDNQGERTVAKGNKFTESNQKTIPGVLSQKRPSSSRLPTK
jgi:hypothetical protein